MARVTVTELRDSVYYADLVLTQNDQELHVSSRPSDAIALAARTGAPLFATTDVLDNAGIEIKDEEAGSRGGTLPGVPRKPDPRGLPDVSINRWPEAIEAFIKSR